MVLICLCLAGCSGIIKDFPEQNLFTIDPPLPGGGPGTFEAGNGLLVRQFDISPEFESSFFIYKVSASRFTGDYYNKFMVAPARMISDAVKEVLYGSPFFRPAPASEPSDIAFRLGGKITRLYADIRSPKQPLAVMALRLSLEKRTASGFVPVINKVYDASLPIPGARPEDLVQAWNRGLAQILTAFFLDVEALE
ncbi:MAG: ABC transporter [Desulfotignum sp.]|nr:ABC transporter [Desulfotignum sp.]MCF8126598.1 ABC transporter [Desulfotignum sp.]